MSTPSSIEERIARLEGSFEQIERRMDTLLRRQWWTLGAIAVSVLATVLMRLL